MQLNDIGLNVTVFYDTYADLISINFEQDERLITIGFDITEAQLFNAEIAKAITDAILGKLDLTPEIKQ